MVIAIIAILAAIVMVSVTGYIKKSKHAALLADIRQLTTVATTYFINPNHGNYDNLCGDTPGGDSQFPEIMNTISSLTGQPPENNYVVRCIDSNLDNPIATCSNNTWGFDYSFTYSDSSFICVDSSGVYEDNNGLMTDGDNKCCCTANSNQTTGNCN